MLYYLSRNYLKSQSERSTISRNNNYPKNLAIDARIHPTHGHFARFIEDRRACDGGSP